MFLNSKKTKYLLPTLVLFFCATVPQIAAATSWAGTVIESFFWFIFIGIGGAVVWLGGTLLDFAILELVIKMGDTLTATVGVAVDQLWVVVRDLLNMLFIFALVYIGIQTILDSGKADTRKLLGKLIIAALLINFSLLITKTIIDFSNIAATQIYDQITITGSYTINGQTIGTGEAEAGKSISGGIMNVLGFSSFDKGAIASKMSGEADWLSVKVIVYGFLMMIFMIIIGLIFATAALILVKRFVMLIVFMIFSPLMFAGFIFPKLERAQSYWWSEFFKHAFIAPAFLFMMFISLNVLRAMPLQGSTFEDGYTANGSFGAFLMLFVAAGFMIASMMIAQKMGSSAAGATLGALKSAGNAARGAAAGAAYRTGVGLPAGGVRNLWDRMDRAAESGSTTAKVTRTLLGGESTRRGLTAARDYKAGGGLGRADVEKQSTERRQRATRSIAVGDLRKDLGSSDQDVRERALYNASSAQIKELAETADGRATLIANAAILKGDHVKSLMDNDQLDDEFRNQLATKRGEGVLATVGTASGPKNVGKLSKDKLGSIPLTELVKPKNAVTLSAKQIDDLDLADPDKNSLKKARNDAFIAVASAAPGSTTHGITHSDVFARSNEEAGKIDPEVFTKNAMYPYLTPAILQERMKNGLSTPELASIVAEFQPYYDTAPGSVRSAWRGWVTGNSYGGQFAIAGFSP